jgi:hypothetical protein
MEQRQTLKGPAGPGGLARWSGRRALPWIGLVVVLSTIAYGLHVAAVSSSPGVEAAPGAATTYRLTTDDPAAYFGEAQRPTIVVITAYDAATGARVQEQCTTTSDRVASGALTVDLQYLRDVEAALCQSG